MKPFSIKYPSLRFEKFHVRTNVAKVNFASPQKNLVLYTITRCSQSCIEPGFDSNTKCSFDHWGTLRITWGITLHFERTIHWINETVNMFSCISSSAIGLLEVCYQFPTGYSVAIETRQRCLLFLLSNQGFHFSFIYKDFLLFSYINRMPSGWKIACVWFGSLRQFFSGGFCNWWDWCHCKSCNRCWFAWF